MYFSRTHTSADAVGGLSKFAKAGLIACIASTLLAAGCGDDGPTYVPPDNPPPNDDSGIDADYIFNQGAIRTYELKVSQANWDLLNASALDEEYVPATLHFEGREYGPIGLRYKGSGGTLEPCVDEDTGELLCDKLSMKLKFSEYDKDLRFHGIKRLNFHSMINDVSMMRERLAYSLFRESGVPAPRATHAWLEVNGEPMGLFALVEQIDGSFARDRFADGEGNVYKEVWPVSDDEEAYIEALKTNRGSDADVSRMMRFAEALRAAEDDAAVAGVLEDWLDVDTLMAYLAVDRAIENWDGIVNRVFWEGQEYSHNYYWYEETERDQVWLIPWDMDLSLSFPNPFEDAFGVEQPLWNVVPESCDPIRLPAYDDIFILSPACDPLLRTASTVLWVRYVDATKLLLDGAFRLDALNSKLDAYEEQIAFFVANDDRAPSLDSWSRGVRRLRETLASLRQATEAVVKQPSAVQSTRELAGELHP